MKIVDVIDISGGNQWVVSPRETSRLLDSGHTAVVVGACQDGTVCIEVDVGMEIDGRGERALKDALEGVWCGVELHYYEVHGGCLTAKVTAGGLSCEGFDGI
jgi:hypothetical protein